MGTFLLRAGLGVVSELICFPFRVGETLELYSHSSRPSLPSTAETTELLKLHKLLSMFLRVFVKQFLFNLRVDCLTLGDGY